MRNAAFISINLMLLVLVVVTALSSGDTKGYAQGEATATLLPTNTAPAPIDPTTTPQDFATPRRYYETTPNAEPGTLDEASGLPIPTMQATYRPSTQFEYVNILLVGHDSESDGEPGGGFRTDTLIVVSINRTAGTVSMLSLPRDLYIYVPDWRYVRINTVWDRGQYVYGGNAGGFRLMQEAVYYNYSLQLHYYAIIDFSGFKQIIDELGGITVAVDCPIQDYRFTGEYDANDEPLFELTTLDVGLYEMDSITALFYARSRRNANDFDRGRRQQQIIRAIFREARDSGYLLDVPALYNDLMAVVATNMPLDVMLQLAPLGLALEPNNIESHFLYTGRETQGYTAASGAAVQLPTERLFEEIEAFLIPPTQNRLVLEGARIGVFDSSGVGRRWDVVAADRLVWEGLNPLPLGEAVPPGTISLDNGSVLVDYTGESKGSSIDVIARILNIPPANVYSYPNPDRTVDYAVYLAPGYNACVDRQIITPRAE